MPAAYVLQDAHLAKLPARLCAYSVVHFTM